MRVCYYHEDRPAIGICMHCRVPICAACTTRLQGVNHCHKCLAALAARKDDGKSAFEPMLAVSVLVIGVGLLLLFGACWLVEGALAP
jgi:hypothetical protein